MFCGHLLNQVHDSLAKCPNFPFIASDSLFSSASTCMIFFSPAFSRNVVTVFLASAHSLLTPFIHPLSAAQV